MTKTGILKIIGLILIVFGVVALVYTFALQQSGLGVGIGSGSLTVTDIPSASAIKIAIGIIAIVLGVVICFAREIIKILMK